MPRPKSKSELIILSTEKFKCLMQTIDDMDAKERDIEFPVGTMNRNIRDVLAHLYHWHLMFLEWYQVGMSGNKPFMPAPGYTWKETPKLNQWIWQKYSTYSTDRTAQLFTSSHQRVMQIVQYHSNDELF